MHVVTSFSCSALSSPSALTSAAALALLLQAAAYGVYSHVDPNMSTESRWLRRRGSSTGSQALPRLHARHNFCICRDRKKRKCVSGSLVCIIPGTCRTRWIPNIWHRRRARRAISPERLRRLREDPSWHNLGSNGIDTSQSVTVYMYHQSVL